MSDLVALCPSAELVESGRAHVFDMTEFGRPVRGFVLRHEGRLVAYVNRCAHVPTEMDWQPGEFFDASRQYLICSMHGAVYQPSDGLCVGGPCAGARLVALQVAERDGQVYWYPSDRFRPAFAD
ncbi:MAG: hypothetical protein RL375_1198 [Pseudomonadota bacterium]|jgi:nitrite reductase/ring-hydroxylating ferredoxin subunit